MDTIQFIATTPDKLREEIVRDMTNLFGTSEKKEPDADDLLTRTEAATFLKTSLVTLWKWTTDGKIIAYGLGNKVYYKKSELLSSLRPLKSDTRDKV